MGIVAASGCRTAKVKVAERGQAEAADIERVEAVREALGPSGRIRVDANGGWETGQAARMLRQLAAFGLSTASLNNDTNNVGPRFGFAYKPLNSDKLVIRGGYGQLFDRLNGVQKVGNQFQAFGFQQPLTCLGPSRTGQCLGSLASDPLSGFRIGRRESHRASGH